jgi:pimeloyl-ACP methyl ester carboxylesterase
MTHTTPQLVVTERAPASRSGPWGPVVVFLHGLGCERQQFSRQLDALDPRLRLLALDLPGHGESPELRAGRYDIASITDAVGEELHALGHTDLVVVGHSAGGLIALRLAVRHPELVRGILLLDSNIALSEAELRANRTRAAESETGDWRRHFMDSMSAAWGISDGSDRDLRTAVFRTLERTPEHVVRPLWHDILTLEPEYLWRRCQVPALYIRTRRDTDLPLLQSLNPLISTIDLRPRCDGHWPHLRCADVVNDLLHRFVAQLTIDDD